jgi:hypothetical protein
LAEVEEAKSAVKTSLQCQRLKRFDVLEIEVEKLIAKGETVRYVLPAKEIFNMIESAYVAIGHGQDRMKKEVPRKYTNVMIEMINIFIDV